MQKAVTHKAGQGSWISSGQGSSGSTGSSRWHAGASIVLMRVDWSTRQAVTLALPRWVQRQAGAQLPRALLHRCCADARLALLRRVGPGPYAELMICGQGWGRVVQCLPAFKGMHAERRAIHLCGLDSASLVEVQCKS